MGAVQVLRVAAVAAALTTARPVAAGEPVAILDARTGEAGALATSRAALAAAVAADPALTPVTEPAQLGDDQAIDGAMADQALAETRERFGALDCAGVREPGQRAVQLLAGREAAGEHERERLRTAWTYLLLCADRDGARVPAQGFADRLRALGGAPAVPAEVWERYPALDAGSELALSTWDLRGQDGSLDGAEVWLDHRRVGKAPMTLLVSGGGHVLGLARGTERAGLVFLDAGGGSITLSIGLRDFASPYAATAATVRRWQAGAPVRAADVAAAVAPLDARIAIVLEGDSRATVWAVRAGGETAQLADGDATRPAELTAAIDAGLAGGGEPALLTDADVVDDALARANRGSKRPTPWWVYAAIGGAAAAGAAAIWALDAGEDRQRIVLTFP